MNQIKILCPKCKALHFIIIPPRFKDFGGIDIKCVMCGLKFAFIEKLELAKVDGI